MAAEDSGYGGAVPPDAEERARVRRMLSDLPSHAVGTKVHYRGVPHMTGVVSQAELMPKTLGLYAVRWDDEPWREAAWYSYHDLEKL